MAPRQAESVRDSQIVNEVPVGLLFPPLCLSGFFIKYQVLLGVSLGLRFDPIDQCVSFYAKTTFIFNKLLLVFL